MPASLADAAVTPSLLLERVRAARAAADESERAVLQLAVVWADAHPDLDESGAQRWWKAPPAHFRGNELVDGGPDTGVVSEQEFEWFGIPALAWGAAASLGVANNMSTRSAECLIRDGLVLRHRLPRTWTRVVAGEVPAWRARRVAQAVLGAPRDVVDFVDAEVADRVHVLGPVQLARELAAAMIRLHAEDVELEAHQARTARYVKLHASTLDDSWLVDMSIRGDWNDLSDFDRTVARIAAALAASDHPSAQDPLQTRRAIAVGILADPDAAATLLDQLDPADDPTRDEPPLPDEPAEPEDFGPAGAPASYDDDPDDEPNDEPREEPTPAPTVDRARLRRPRAKDVVVYLHLSESAVRGMDPVAHDEHGRVVLTQVVQEFCSRPDAKITVRPVIDLNDGCSRSHDGPDDGRVSPRLAERVGLRDRTCAFPWCQRIARRCDKDHLLAHADGGPTCLCNLAPLCRFHHLLKTHDGWSYEALELGLYLWTDRHGQTVLRTRDGTRNLTPGEDADYRMQPIDLTVFRYFGVAGTTTRKHVRLSPDFMIGVENLPLAALVLMGLYRLKGPPPALRRSCARLPLKVVT